MKIFLRAAAIASVIFLSLNLAACGSSNSSKSADSSSSATEIVKKEPIAEPLTEADFVVDGLTLGMSKSEVERKLGKATDIRVNDWYEFGKNYGVHFKNGVSDVIGVAAENTGTPRKIFVGSTFSEVEKAYGKDYRRDNSKDETFTIGYSLGEKLLVFIVDRKTNSVMTIMAVEDINDFSIPSANSKPAANSKPQQKPQQPREQPKPKVDNRAAAEQVLSDFTNAYLNRDRAGMENCSFYEERNFTREKGYDLLETQMQVFDTVNQVYSGTFGNSWQYTYEIFSMDKINADTYKCEVVMIMGTDTLRYPNIRVCNVGGRWLVDADSFAYSASLSFTNAIYSGY